MRFFAVCMLLFISKLADARSSPLSSEDHAVVLREREARVLGMCKEYYSSGNGSSSSLAPVDADCDPVTSNDARKLVFDYKLYGCLPRGTGSRFWDATFSVITRDLMKRGSPDTPEKYLVFMSCRHPFQRIAMAYGVEARRAEEAGKSIVLPFTKFVEKDVINAGLRGSWKNPYLKPCHLECNPCCTHFDVIGDFATLAEDFNYIKKSQGLDSVREVRDAAEKDGTTIEPSTMTKYFAALPKPLVDGIIKVYQKDFELYGYSVDQYL
ncbi:unnamed protein product [Notodromas monacha]|uniref:Carbohydrate sulfotransferase n=1 Tax=Notodromas monacha TaxID=399045 RepID=A0A7R9BZM4_9CRUS|nr:unnamed protein product [Notodromas monacha]CAG0923615.1 unnamed protein product [Notodromas monacha]